MCIRNKLIGLFHLYIDRCKGKRIVMEINDPKYKLGHLAGYSVSGFIIEIHCQKKHYRRSYDKWYIPNKNNFAFSVYCTISEDAPIYLKTACAIGIDIPALLPDTVSDEGQSRAAINAYLDILISRLANK